MATRHHGRPCARPEGKRPTGGAFIERFDRTCREQVLTPYLFDSIEDVRQITDEWLERCSEIRPHDVLGSLPPARYRERLLAEKNSTSELPT